MLFDIAFPVLVDPFQVGGTVGQYRAFLGRIAFSLPALQVQQPPEKVEKCKSGNYGGDVISPPSWEYFSILLGVIVDIYTKQEGKELCHIIHSWQYPAWAFYDSCDNSFSMAISQSLQDAYIYMCVCYLYSIFVYINAIYLSNLFNRFNLTI